MIRNKDSGIFANPVTMKAVMNISPDNMMVFFLPIILNGIPTDMAPNMAPNGTMLAETHKM